jgi:hypothetical protein
MMAEKTLYSFARKFFQSEQKIYQWRYRDGSWSTAAIVGSGVISAPVLMHVGAAQLGLFAISTDLQLNTLALLCSKLDQWPAGSEYLRHQRSFVWSIHSLDLG